MARKKGLVVIDVRKNGRKGGFARARALTAEQRSAAARKAVTTRWANVRASAAAAVASKGKAKGGRAGKSARRSS